MSTEYPAVPGFTGNIPSWIQRASTVINNILQGKMNVSTTLTLDANAASTTITDARIGFETHVILTPTTANAAAELGNGTLYISETSRVNGSVVVTHANNAQTDRTFRVSYIG